MKYILMVVAGSAFLFSCKKETLKETPADNEIRVMVYAKSADSSIVATTKIVRLKLK